MNNDLVEIGGVTRGVQSVGPGPEMVCIHAQFVAMPTAHQYTYTLSYALATYGSQGTPAEGSRVLSTYGIGKTKYYAATAYMSHILRI